MTASASGRLPQTAREVRGSAAVIPLAGEPPAKIIVDPPLPDALARGLVVIQYRTENLRIQPVFGPGPSMCRRGSDISTSPWMTGPGIGWTRAASH
jgi:hypothetical protein